jgi:hypothetical protein
MKLQSIFKDRKNWLWIALLLALVLIGSALMAYYTRTGAGIRGDSVRYVMLARNMLRGEGFSRTSGGGEIYPETGFAPFLPVVLAGFGALGLDLYSVGRALNLFLYAANIFLIGYIIWRATKSITAMLIGASLFLLADNIFEWHAWLMSEALFISLSLIAFLSIEILISKQRTAALYVAGLSAAAASLTRYAGVSLIPTGALVILLLYKGNFRSRLIRAVSFSLIAFLPFVLWFFRNQSLGVEGFANRKIIFHPIRPEVLRVYLFEIASWFMPEEIVVHRVVRGAFALLVAAFPPALFAIQYWKEARSQNKISVDNSSTVTFLLAFFLIPFYVLVLAINSFLLDAATTFSAVIRYAMPILIFLIILEVVSFAHAAKRLNLPLGIKVAAIGYSLILMGFFGYDTLQMSAASTLELGYTGIIKLWPGVVNELEEHDADIPIISNNPEMVYYLVNRPAYMKPINYDVYQQSYRQDFEQQLQLARKRMSAGSIFVFFDEPSDEEQEILELLDADVIYETPRVKIFAYADSQ